MTKSIMTLAALIVLPFGIANAEPECKKAKCDKAATVAKAECKSKCDKATTVAAKKDCAKACDKAAALVVADCNFKCEKSVAKVFTAFDKNKDGKLCKGEFNAFVKAMTAKKDADKATAAN